MATLEEMKNLPKSDRVLRAEKLRLNKEYKTGREHVIAGKSDFYRLSLLGEDREAYMLGRFEQAFDLKFPRLRNKRVNAPELLSDDPIMDREREVS